MRLNLLLLVMRDYAVKIRKSFGLIAILGSLVLTSGCVSKRNSFNNYNLANSQVFNSIFENYTTKDHISKLYGNPDYIRNEKIWFYQYQTYNAGTRSIDPNMIVLEFSTDGTLVDKRIFRYQNTRSAYYNSRR